MALSDDIAAAALKPSQVTGDAGSVTSRSIDEMIKADQYGKAIQVAESDAGPWGGLRMTRVILPGGA